MSDDPSQTPNALTALQLVVEAFLVAGHSARMSMKNSALIRCMVDERKIKQCINYYIQSAMRNAEFAMDAANVAKKDAAEAANDTDFPNAGRVAKIYADEASAHALVAEKAMNEAIDAYEALALNVDKMSDNSRIRVPINEVPPGTEIPIRSLAQVMRDRELGMITVTQQPYVGRNVVELQESVINDNEKCFYCGEPIDISAGQQWCDTDDDDGNVRAFHMLNKNGDRCDCQ